MKNVKRKTGIWRYIFIILILSIILFFLMNNCSIKLYLKKVGINLSVEMTNEDYCADFKDLIDFAEKNIPHIYAYDELYGIGYSEIKNYYNNLISHSQSDFEYLIYLTAFMNNIPSFHFSMGTPNVDNIDNGDNYWLSQNKSFKDAQVYWKNIIHNECKKYYESNYSTIIFSYYSGNYYGIDNSTDNIFENINYGKLLTVNGIKIDEYIKLLPSSLKLKYDHVCEKPFRDLIIFNDKFGEECVVEYESFDGTVHCEKMYCGIASETLLNYIDYFKVIDGVFLEDNLETSDYNPIRITQDYENDILIIELNTFDGNMLSENEIISEIKKHYDEFENIVIDLRKNGGGKYKLSQAALANLISEDIIVNNDIYCTKSYFEENKKSFNFYWDDMRQLYVKNDNQVIKGQANNRKKLYLLISDYTGSSADWFVYEFKKNRLGTIIGTNNTSGERCGSVTFDCLEKSGIFFYYTPYETYDNNGISNSVYGTAPDIYLSSSVKNYFIRSQIKETGQDPYTYDNRMKWDNVLTETIEIIKENGNDQTNNPPDE